MQKALSTEYISLALLCLSAVILIALQWSFLGWILLGIGMTSLLFCRSRFRKYVGLVYLSLAILGVTPITTDTSNLHFIQMGIPLILAIALPYGISKYLYQESAIRFRFHHGRRWFKTEMLYIVITATLAYLVLPFFLENTGSYLNWMIEPGVERFTRLFIGMNALGIWDELFFISTVLGVLRLFFSFQVANVAQSIIFTSFLYELGFRGWGVIMIFIFALSQGYIFKKTKSLFYVITIHLTIDFVLYLALIHAYHPGWMPIFLIN